MAGKYQSNADALVSEKADKLAQLLGATLQNSQRAKIEQQQRENDLAMAQQLQQQNPNMPVSVGDVRLGGDNPLRDLLAQASIQDRNLDNERLETKAVQDEFNRLQGGTREKVKALDEIDTLLKNPSQASWGQISTALSRASGEKGALAEGDVKRALPTTLRSTAAGLVNFLVPGTMNPYAEAQKQEISKLVDEKRGVYNQELSKSGRELDQRASTLAPTLARQGKLPKVMKSLGAGSIAPVNTPQAAPAQAPMSFEEWKAAKKAGKL